MEDLRRAQVTGRVTVSEYESGRVRAGRCDRRIDQRVKGENEGRKIRG